MLTACCQSVRRPLLVPVLFCLLPCACRLGHSLAGGRYVEAKLSIPFSAQRELCPLNCTLPIRLFAFTFCRCALRFVSLVFAIPPCDPVRVLRPFCSPSSSPSTLAAPCPQRWSISAQLGTSGIRLCCLDVAALSHSSKTSRSFGSRFA